MKDMIILIVVGAFGRFPEDRERRLMELEIQGRIETIQAEVLLKLGRTLRRMLGDLRRLVFTQVLV